MKKWNFVLVGFFALFMAMPVGAQLRVGALAGLNVASVSVDGGNDDYSSRLGLGLGGVIDYALKQNLHLHIEPMYLQKGSKIESGTQKMTYKTTYIEIPLLVKYGFQTGGNIAPYVMAGPSLGFNLDAKFDVEGQGEVDDDETKIFDFGVGLGGGASMPMGNNSIFAEVRYVLGLPNVNKDDSEPEVKNRGLQIFAGITFPLDAN